MIEPVQPRPTITTSVDGSLRVIVLVLESWRRLRRCSRARAADADGRQGIALVVAIDPVAVVVLGAGEADHLPPDHAAIAAVDGIGEESLAGGVQHLLEEPGGAGAGEGDRALLHAGEHLVLLLVGE